MELVKEEINRLASVTKAIELRAKLIEKYNVYSESIAKLPNKAEEENNLKVMSEEICKTNTNLEAELTGFEQKLWMNIKSIFSEYHKNYVDRCIESEEKIGEANHAIQYCTVQATPKPDQLEPKVGNTQ